MHLTKSSHTQAAAFWRADWFVGVAVLLATVLLHLSTDFTASLERRLYDMASTRTSRAPSERIAIIAMDEQSMANIGPWPWPRDVHARLIDRLAAAQAQTVVYTELFSEPQRDPGLVFIRKIKDALASGVEAGADATGTTHIAALVEQAQTALDTDAVLAASLQKAGNVLLPSVFQLGEPLGKSEQPLPDFAQTSALEGVKGYAVRALRAQEPLALLGQVAAGIGHLNFLADGDGTVRTAPLLVNYAGRAVPSLALLAVVKSLNLNVGDIQLHPAGSLHIGTLRIPTDEAARIRPQFYPERAGKAAFTVDSFGDVLSGKIPASRYAGKIVIVGATAAGVGARYPVPGYAALSSAEAMAHISSSILSEHFIVQPAWGAWVSLAALVAVAAYVLVGLPRLPAAQAAAITLLLCGVLLATEFGLLWAAAIWTQLVLPATALVLVYLALVAKRFWMADAGQAHSEAESAEANRMMGLALQSQGQLDMAFERFRRATMGEALMDKLYSLAQDFERKHQFSQAEAVYRHMATFDPGYKDILTKLARSSNQAGTVMLGSGASHPGGVVLAQAGALEMPMLGRYKVEKELGKGAMGVVYLGHDPKIGRVVAIKTLALSQAFAGSDLADARERFFREAETAGRLQHQNIVTIFDAGEAQELAFIAMEFLKGQDLTAHCKRGQLLPVATVLSIVARVAAALAYAHQQNVVHRDIKPANIMFDAASDSVKVTDFGIARITDSSKTKTGLVLGTPSFMSPEQLAGKKVDGRTDLYSLGVMLYQLLSGALPFRGDSMSELMFKIANEEAADIRRMRPELSEALAHVVALALSKRPETRYQTGDQFAADLRAVAAQALGFEKTVAFTSTVAGMSADPGRVVGGANI